MFLVLLPIMGCDRQPTLHQGYIEARFVYFSSPLAGYLKSLPVQRGQLVPKNTVLGQLEISPDDYLLKQKKRELRSAMYLLTNLKSPKRLPELNAQKAKIEQVDAKIKLAMTRLHRINILFKKGIVTQDTKDAQVAKVNELNQLKIEYQASLRLYQMGSRSDKIKAQQEDVDAINEAIFALQWKIKRKSFIATEKGMVYDNVYEVGEWVPAGQPVISFVPESAWKVVIFLPLKSISGLHQGATLDFMNEYQTAHGKAVVDYISQEAEFLPPVIYSRDNAHQLVYRVEARLLSINAFKIGEPVLVAINES